MVCSYYPSPLLLPFYFSGTALEQDPANVQAGYLQGLIKFRRQDFRGSLTDLSKSIQQNNSVAELYNLRGEIYYTALNYGDALTDFSTAIKINPHFMMAFANRANVLLSFNNCDLASKDIEIVLQTDALSGYAYWDKGLLFFKRDKDTSNAALQLNTSIKLDPTQVLFYQSRGWLSAQMGSSQASLADYDQAIQLDPSNGETYLELGLIYESLGKTAAALDNYAKAAKLANANNGCRYCAYDHIGLIYFSQGQYDKAIEYYTKAIDTDPQKPQGYQDRAQAYAAKGDVESAQADSEKARALANSGPGN